MGNRKEVGVANEKFATPQGAPVQDCSVADRTSAKAVLHTSHKDLVKEAGRETPIGAMGNDISKPLQGLTDIPFIEIDNAPPRDNSPALQTVAERDKNCDQPSTKCLSTEKKELKISSIGKTSDEKIIPESEKIVELETVSANDINELVTVSANDISELETVSVNNINELEIVSTNNISELETVSANNVSELETVSVNDISELETVSVNNISELETVSVNNISELETVSVNNISELETVSVNNISELETVSANNISELETVSVNNISELETVSANNISELETVSANNISELETVPLNSIREMSALSSPSLVMKISELENTDNADNLKISAESDSVLEKYVSCDETTPANETEEEKSVRDNLDTYNSNLAKSGSVASCEEYSSDGIHDREPTPAVESVAFSDEPRQNDQDMYKVCFDKIKCNSEGNLYSLKKDCQIMNNIVHQKSINNEVTEETDESSEDELSESDQSETDNVVKNDSGCWDERENSLFLSESDNQVTSACSVSDVLDSKCKRKKQVRWADIDGQRKLTHERESSVCSSCSSEEDDNDTEEDEPEKEEEEESESEEEEEEDEVDENKGVIKDLTKVKLVDKSEEKDWAKDVVSSEEESEDEVEEGSRNDVQLEGKDKEVIKEAGAEESSEDSEDESSEEENGNEFE